MAAHILVIEDDDSILNLFRIFLERRDSWFYHQVRCSKCQGRRGHRP